MKKLWLPLIIFASLATILFVPLSNQHKHNASESTILIPQSKPSRIISLAPNLTEILFALGLGESIVAVSNGSNYPPEAFNKKKVGSFWQPNTEAVIAARPDLVITLSHEQQKSTADTLERLGFKVLTLKIEKIEELLKAIEKIGFAADCRERADKLVTNIKNRINNLKSKLTSTKKLKVLWIVQTEPLRVAGKNTFINELIELAGGINAIGPTIQKYPQISSEELLACKTQIIIQSSMSPDNIPAQQQAAQAFWGKWPSLPAVKNNRIYVVDSDIVLRLGPRLCQGIESIARCLHPDIFNQKQNSIQQVKEVNG